MLVSWVGVLVFPALRRRCEIARARKLEPPPREIDDVDEGWGESVVT